MIGYYLMIVVLVLIGAALTNEMVRAGGFWGALIMTSMFAILAAVVA